ncbi:hypothetical protein I7I50_10443 [Histoplasma capsulatum G186AR]|uniref:Uncharacterized protein n=1 Tax=Ajellomyces capsulatus TaxID=5037 RepID=A0A8H8D6P1_AJECA|nr:hypothetical protein I7I52_01682 [Histoplasma capsulatum]QSS69228.1 hypothetical protein I7I50_10443 [Histoplasma capsulatum G186AR]
MRRKNSASLFVATRRTSAYFFIIMDTGSLCQPNQGSFGYSIRIIPNTSQFHCTICRLGLLGQVCSCLTYLMLAISSITSKHL